MWFYSDITYNTSIQLQEASLCEARNKTLTTPNHKIINKMHQLLNKHKKIISRKNYCVHIYENSRHILKCNVEIH